MGSVNPLLAIYEEAKKQNKNWEWFWVGTKNGIERKIVESLGISYEWVPSAKFRRYFSWLTILDPFLFIIAFFRSLLIVSTTKPDIVIGTGSFVQVPIMWAAWLFRKKIIIHQQDVRPTLSNKLTAFCADKITTSFEKSTEDFPKQKTEYIGNPVRDAVQKANPKQAREKFRLNSGLPTFVIIGGSSGARALNEWVWRNIDKFIKVSNVIHLTGPGKADDKIKKANYHQIEYLHGDMFHVLAQADLVLSRAGISTLTELACLKKPAILIPMPGTHQEDNAFYFAGKYVGFAYRQDQLDEVVARKVLELLSSSKAREDLAQGMGEFMKQGSRERMVEIIESL